MIYVLVFFYIRFQLCSVAGGKWDFIFIVGLEHVHSVLLVKMSYVSGYSKTQVTLTNGEKLLLSKYKYQDFVKAYLRFLKKGAGL